MLRKKMPLLKIKAAFLFYNYSTHLFMAYKKTW